MAGLEPTVAQPLSKLVPIARAASRCLQHPALDVIGLLRGFKAFGEASRSLPGAPKRKQEQEHGEDDGARTHLGRQEPDLVFVMIQKLQERNGDGDEQEIVFAAENDEQPDAKGENLLPAKTDELRSGKLVAKIGERKAFPVLNESEDVLVLIDEAHRSHTSGLHQNLLDALPNAARIGFTGTPIEEKNKKKTRQIFGTYIDRYLLRDAEADGAIVKILYEGRELKADVTDKGTLDGLFDATFAGKSADEREAIKDRYATRARVLNAADPLKAKAIDVLRHYIVNILPNDLKAQLVAASRELAVAA